MATMFFKFNVLLQVLSFIKFKLSLFLLDDCFTFFTLNYELYI
jgi:hypothetical protein